MMIKSKNRQITPLSIIVVLFLFIALFGPQVCYSKEKNDLTPVMACIELIIRDKTDKIDLTLREVYKKCEDENAKRLAGDERRIHDKVNSKRPFTLMAHNPTYFLLLANNFVGYDETIFNASGSDINFRNIESQFQISFKSLLWDEPAFDIYLGYTNRSFWQMYNKPFSNPFREYNHEPEGWFQFYPEKSLFDFVLTEFRLGLVHQSNGQGDPLSRSWNRAFLNFTFEKENLVVNFKPWLRFQEDSSDDNNPDITDYLGHGEVRFAYKIKDPGFGTLFSIKGKDIEIQDITLSLMSRNNIESGFSKGAIELGASCHLGVTENLKLYIQYFSGYGESLIDYNHYVSRLGVGIMLSDWL